MGKGIDLARHDNPLHAAMIDNLKDQLLIVFLNRLGGSVDIPVAEIDATGQYTLALSLKGTTFHFETNKKH